MSKEKKPAVKVPTAKQLPSGNWRVQLRVNGERVSVVSETEEKVIAEAIAIREGIIEKSKTPKDHITLSAATDKYILSRENVLSPSTIRQYKETKKYHGAALQKKRICNIDEQVMQQAINAEAKSYSYKTIKNAFGLYIAVISEYKLLNTKRIRYPQRVKKEHAFLDAGQIVELITAAQGNICEIPILLAVWLGLRRSEIMGLQWESIDFAGSTIMIEHAMVISENREYVIKPEMKNTESRRRISCPAYIMSKLEQYQPNVLRRTGQVFKIHPNTIYDNLKMICDKNNIPFVGVHGLRHTNASVMLSLGIVDKVAMKRGGWSTDNTMKNIYQHVFKNDRQSADDVINGYFDSLIAKTSHERHTENIDN